MPLESRNDVILAEDAVMADGSEQAEEVQISFDLLDGIDLSNDAIDINNLTQQHQDVIQNLMESLDVREAEKTDEDEHAFEPQAAHFRHASCTSEEVNHIADQVYKDATKWQTQWAVNVFKGVFSTTFRQFVAQYYSIFF